MFVELDQAAHTLVVFPLTSFFLSRFKKRGTLASFLLIFRTRSVREREREINSPCPSGEMAIQLFSFFFGIANETKMLLQ